MTYSDKNILTPEFYDFIRSNKSLYGKAVLEQVHEAAEKTNLTSDEKESLAIVLSGGGVNITDGSANNLSLPNQPEVVMKDLIPRRKVQFRSIDSRLYAGFMQDFTGWLKSPFDTTISNAERSSRISMHPSAYTITGYFETHPMPYGTIIVVKQIGNEYYIMQNVSKPVVKWSSDPESNPLAKWKKNEQEIDLSGVHITRGMKPLFETNGTNESKMTRDGAQNNMNTGTLSRYRTMLGMINFKATINDAIAKNGTSREVTTKNSQHFFGRALDLNTAGISDVQKLQMVDAASRAGFVSMGFGRNILHVDWGTRARSWTYPGAPDPWAGVKMVNLYKWVKTGGYSKNGTVSSLVGK